MSERAQLRCLCNVAGLGAVDADEEFVRVAGKRLGAVRVAIGEKAEAVWVGPLRPFDSAQGIGFFKSNACPWDAAGAGGDVFTIFNRPINFEDGDATRNGFEQLVDGGVESDGSLPFSAQG